MSPLLPDDAAVGSSLRSELGGLCQGIDKKWRSLVSVLEAKEESVLREHFDSLQKWFNLSEDDLTSWSEHGLRMKVRDRIQKLILVPLLEHLGDEVPEQVDDKKSAGSGPRDPVSELLDRWEHIVSPIADQAQATNDKLVRKLDRMAKADIRRGMEVTEMRQFATIWAAARPALESFAVPARALASLVETEASDTSASRLAAALPAIIARAVCDFHFQRCSAELEQLDSWWATFSASSKRNQALWERLQENEGLLLKRLEAGIEELRAERTRYNTFATFGTSRAQASGRASARRLAGGEWPEESMALLAQAVSGMRRRLKPMRDSAAWRVVDAARTLHRQLRAEGQDAGKSPWEQATPDEGVAVLCRSVGVSAPPAKGLASSNAHPSEYLKNVDNFGHIGDAVDVALVFVQRLDCLTAVSADLRSSLESCLSGSVELSRVFEELMLGLASLSEDLLGVLDDPEPESLHTWAESWVQFVDTSGAGKSLDDSIKLLRQGKSYPSRKQLLLLRGLQALLDRASFRAWFLTAASAKDATIEECNGDQGAEEACIAHRAQGSSAEPPAHRDVHDSDTGFTDAPAVPSPADAVVKESPRGHLLSSSRYAVASPTPSDAVEESPPRAIEHTVPAPTPVPTIEPARESVPTSVKAVPTVGTAARSSAPAPTSAHASQSTQPATQAPSASRAAYSPITQRDFAAPATRTPVPASGAVPAHSPLRQSDFGMPSTPFRMSRSASSCTSVAASRPGTSLASGSRPMTPSWLEPPWPRACPGFRPDTPSTACDDADLSLTASQVPRWKCVEGQVVSLRPSSSNVRLAPLELPSRPGHSRRH